MDVLHDVTVYDKAAIVVVRRIAIMVDCVEPVCPVVKALFDQGSMRGCMGDMCTKRE